MSGRRRGWEAEGDVLWREDHVLILAEGNVKDEGLEEGQGGGGLPEDIRAGVVGVKRHEGTGLAVRGLGGGCCLDQGTIWKA